MRTARHPGFISIIALALVLSGCEYKAASSGVRQKDIFFAAIITAPSPTPAATPSPAASVSPAPITQAPTNLTYSSLSPVFTKGVAIPPLSPTSQGGAPTSYSVSPSLPPGLNLNAVTGIISGTPSTAASVTNFVVTAANTGGSTNRALSITIIPAPAPSPTPTPVVTANYYIAPNGNDSNSGTITAPFATLNKAWSVIKAGDLVYMRGGTYAITVQQNLANKSGTAGNTIKVWNYPGEKPILDFSAVISPTQKRCINISSGSYIHFKGIRVTNLKQQVGGDVHAGFYLDSGSLGSSNNIIENCEADHIGGYGFTVGSGNNNNLFLNCDAHHNADPYTFPAYDGSNGFGVTGAGNTSTGNIFRGCRAWLNSDDGFDMFGSEGVTTFDNCWSFWNGYLDETLSPNLGGNGVGFKLGPTSIDSPTLVKKTLKNCLSFENKFRGFDENGAKHAFAFYNNVSYKDGEGGYCFAYPGATHILKNNIAYADVDFIAFISAASTMDHNNFTGNNTYTGCSVSNADFLSTSSVGMNGPRQADGSLPVLNFLRLAPTSCLINSGTNVGLPFNGSAPDLGAFEH